ncbi:MAG: beta-galactosidase [Candidatus Hydrogenedentota bacterium]
MLRFGVCYEPEVWSFDQAYDHIKLMRKAHMNVVRIGECAWGQFEPEQGRYRFDWLEPTLADFRKQQIEVVLCVPTVAPPMWVYTRHPSITRVDRSGARVAPGGRNPCCKNHPEFNILCEGLTQQLARHYAKAEGIFGWQIDSAFGRSDSAECYCDHCEKAFRDWLIKKYKDLDALNTAWGAAKDSQTLRQWNEARLPRADSALVNPSQKLDYCRFVSDSHIGFFKRLRDILKAACPEHAITHNMEPESDAVEWRTLADEVGWPSCNAGNFANEDPYYAAYVYAKTRTARSGHWVMELPAGPEADTTTGIQCESPEQGDLRRRVWQAIANGADGVCFKHWRSPLHGAAQIESGVLDHDGIPRRRYKEIAATGDEVDRAADALRGTRWQPVVGLMRSADIAWTLKQRPCAPGFDYDDRCFELFRSVKRTGHNCSIISPSDSLTGFKAILTSSLAIANAEMAANLVKFVKEGGTLIISAQSGSREANGSMSAAKRPGVLAELAGATVQETLALHHGKTHKINFARGPLIGEICDVGSWGEVLEPTTAQVIAEYAQGRLMGQPAIVHHNIEAGQVFYMGVYLPRNVLEPFIADVLPEYPIRMFPDGIEIAQRRSDAAHYLFVLNHSGERQVVILPKAYPELLRGEQVGPEVTISSNGILILNIKSSGA